MCMVWDKGHRIRASDKKLRSAGTAEEIVLLNRFSL